MRTNRGRRTTGLVTIGLLLCLISLALPAWTVFGRVEPLGIPYDAPEKLTYYRWTIALLVVSWVSGSAALMTGAYSQHIAPALRWLGVAIAVLAAGGLLETFFFAFALTGLCGFSVVLGYCQG